MLLRQSKAEEARAQALVRRLRDLRAIARRLHRSRMTPIQVCEAIIESRLIDRATRAFFSGLPDDERHYWIASLYALLMPQAKRKRLAAYFTPPHLARYAINALVEAGIRPGQHRILDPASGGAAFLVPLAQRIAAHGRRRGARTTAILDLVKTTLHGVEIEQGLADLSRALLRDLLREEIKSSGIDLKGMVVRANTLELDTPRPLFDAVIGNPPYGRVFRPSKAMNTRFKSVIADGYVNLYALFVDQALRWVRPGGVVCLIIPTSFVGGPYFSKLRKNILDKATVLRIDLIDKRSDVFLDVLYDLCVIVLRKKDGTAQIGAPKSALLLVDRPSRELGTVQVPSTASTAVWALPNDESREPLFRPGLVTLQDYGYTAKTGYFVWNREKKRYRVGKKPRANEVPLFWAHNVKPNKPCDPRDGEGEAIGFVKISQESTAIIRGDAILLQRTSNRGQKRRLIAAPVRKSRMPGGRGFVTENHTIVIARDPKKRQQIPIGMLCRLLNAEPVDKRFRRMSGSVSVSTIGLRDLPLPHPADVRKAFVKRGAGDDEAARAAYEASCARAEKAKAKKRTRRSTK